MATIEIVIPEVQLFSLTGHNSPTNSIGITLKPMEWKSINALEQITKITVVEGNRCLKYSVIANDAMAKVIPVDRKYRKIW